MRKLHRGLLGSLVAFLMTSGAAQASSIYIGSYNVTDGAFWESNPPVYSALEAAALVFGPAIGGTYEISTGGTDPNLITNTGWYAVIGIGPGVYGESFSQDLGTPGYDGGAWTPGDDISAYVGDFFFEGPVGEGGTNFVFFTEANAVPEPASLLLLGAGLGAVAARRRLKKRA